jgi:3',5'-cyclic AMP phosphodiesterase CpdA
MARSRSNDAKEAGALPPLPAVVHMSDLHLGAAHTVARFDQMIDRVLALPAPAGGFIVALTGDLVDDAREQGAYDAAVERLARLERAGIPVVVIPGNHDYGFELRVYERFVAPFKHAFYRRFDRGAGIWVVQGSGLVRVAGPQEVTYPKLELLGGIAFIGLDSQEQELEGFIPSLSSDGQLGQAQLARLEVMLASPQVASARARVLMLHHHAFDHLPLHRLKDADALYPLIRGRVHALLFGHNHLLITGDDWRRFCGRLEIPRCYDAGSTTRRYGQHGHAIVMDLNGDPAGDYTVTLPDPR